MIIVKIGGSLIDPKNGQRKADLGKIAQVLSGCQEPLVLVIGGGKLSHDAIAPLLDYDGRQKLELSKYYTRFQRYVSDISEVFSKKGMPVYPVHYSSMIQDRMDFGRLAHFIKGIIDKGFVPLTYGEVILNKDSLDNLSGDDVVLHLANLLHAERAVFLTDVDGVLDEKGRVIERLSKNVCTTVKTSDVKGDTTGGMAGKLQAICRTWHPVAIINGHHPERLKAVLNGKKTIGTFLD